MNCFFWVASSPMRIRRNARKTTRSSYFFASPYIDQGAWATRVARDHGLSLASRASSHYCAASACGWRVPSTTLKPIGAATIAPFVLVQALGLNLWCFCGYCPRSLVLGLGTAQAPDADSHGCCHDEPAEVATKLGAADHQVVGAAMDCCSDPDARCAAVDLPPSATDRLGTPLMLAGSPAERPAERDAGAAAVKAGHWSRGPPGSAVAAALYVRHGALLI